MAEVHGFVDTRKAETPATRKRETDESRGPCGSRSRYSRRLRGSSADPVAETQPDNPDTVYPFVGKFRKRECLVSALHLGLSKRAGNERQFISGSAG